MADRIRRVEYFYTTIDDRPGEGLRILAALTVFPASTRKGAV